MNDTVRTTWHPNSNEEARDGENSQYAHFDKFPEEAERKLLAEHAPNEKHTLASTTACLNPIVSVVHLGS